ncbi:MAG: Ku protein [Gemmatimonadaceae bacterium]
MPRPIASATVSFGLVSVPVNLFSAAETRDDVSFHMLSKKTGARVKQQYIDPTTNEVVPRNEMVKGYEVSKDQYVQFTPSELKVLEEKSTSSIDIAEFVPLESVDREYVDRVYYLGPGKGGTRSYHLLAKALEETERAALGQYAARGQQYLVLLRPKDGVLVMEQLHYGDELRATKDIDVGDASVKASELTLAKQLIAHASNDDFEPSKYRDTVKGRVREAIDKKVAGEEITSEPDTEGGHKIIDLMEALKASLANEAEGKQRTHAAAKTRAREHTRRKKSA